jgi:hypothetical protein
MLVAVLVSALWRHAVHARLVHPDASDKELAMLTRRLTPGLAGYVVMIGAGLFVPVLAVLGYFVVAVYFLVPLRRQ